jgi:metal iron transporter
MNCPVRTDPLPDEGHNQNPPAFAAELTTNNSLNHRVNDTRAKNASQVDLTDGSHDAPDPNDELVEPSRETMGEMAGKEEAVNIEEVPTTSSGGGAGQAIRKKSVMGAAVATARKVKAVLTKYAKFVGPGIMISVAYIDPGKSQAHYSASS